MKLSAKPLFCGLMIWFLFCIVSSVGYGECNPSCDDCECCVNGNCQSGCCDPDWTCCGGHCCNTSSLCADCIDGQCQSPCDSDDCKTCSPFDGGCINLCLAYACETCDGHGNCVVCDGDPNQACCYGSGCYDTRCETCVDGEIVNLCDPNLCQSCEDGNCVSQCDPNDQCKMCNGAGSCEPCGGDPNQECCNGSCCTKTWTKDTADPITTNCPSCGNGPPGEGLCGGTATELESYDYCVILPGEGEHCQCHDSMQTVGYTYPCQINWDVSKMAWCAARGGWCILLCIKTMNPASCANCLCTTSQDCCAGSSCGCCDFVEECQKNEYSSDIIEQKTLVFQSFDCQ